MNQVSTKTKNENVLKTKVKGFKDNIKQSQFRIRSKSSLHNLAGTLYSDSKNRNFSPRRTPKPIIEHSRNSSTGKLQKISSATINPEKLTQSILNNKTLSGLEMRASHIPSFAELNTQLLKQKKDLQNKIMNLKEKIVHEKKLLSNAQYNSKKNQNDLDHFKACYREANIKSQRLNEQIDFNNHDIVQLRADLKRLREEIKNKKQRINIERKNIEQLDEQAKNLKINLMQQEKERNQVKVDLAREQRVMNSASVYSIELENERAVLLLEINQSVNDFKI